MGRATPWEQIALRAQNVPRGWPSPSRPSLAFAYALGCKGAGGGRFGSGLGRGLSGGPGCHGLGPGSRTATVPRKHKSRFAFRLLPTVAPSPFRLAPRPRIRAWLQGCRWRRGLVETRPWAVGLFRPQPQSPGVAGGNWMGKSCCASRLASAVAPLSETNRATRSNCFRERASGTHRSGDRLMSRSVAAITVPCRRPLTPRTNRAARSDCFHGKGHASSVVPRHQSSSRWARMAMLRRSRVLKSDRSQSRICSARLSR